MIEDADGAAITRVGDCFDECFVKFALADGNDLFAQLVALFSHAVEVEAQEVGFHFFEHLGEAIDVFMAVMEVVNHADITHAVFLQCFDDRNLILRLAEPAAMIV